MTGPHRSARRDGTTLRRRPRPSLLAAAYAALTVVALIAWLAVGDTWWSQPINLATFWWTLPAVPLALLAIARRRLVTALSFAVPAAVWLWSYGSAFAPPGPVPPAELRIATFNIFVHAPDVTHVQALVDQHAPDVLVLQEVFPAHQAELEALLAETYPAHVVVQSEGVGGVGVFSRFPIVDEEPVTDASARSRTTEVVTLAVGDRRIQVVPVHLISPCPACGASILERLELEGDVRRAEIGEVLDALDPDVPAIVAGDMNSTERSAPYRRLVGAGFEDPQRAVGSGLGFTWPNQAPFGPLLRIDWVLVRGLEPVAAFVGEGGPSDHRPVVVDVAY